MNCKYCRLNIICKVKKNRKKRELCDNWEPEEWGVAKRIYEKGIAGSRIAKREEIKLFIT